MPEESTTPDLVERQRQAVEAGGRRDWDEAMNFYAADAVWDASPTGLGRFEGAAAIRRFFEDWAGAYEEYGHTSWRAGTSAMGSCLRCSTSMVALLAAQAGCRKHGPGPPLGWRG
jgi:ketosteroid isomerase-like protein